MAVGGRANQRGVVATCNYNARAYGIHSAMPMISALRLCPDLQVLPVDMPKYKAESAKVQAIFRAFTPIVEPLSLDEAYLDVSDCRIANGKRNPDCQRNKNPAWKTRLVSPFQPA